MIKMTPGQVKAWWREKISVLETPAFATSSVELKPPSVDPTVYGNHVSAVFYGNRYWCFTSQTHRDRFLTNFRKVFSARPCGKPEI